MKAPARFARRSVPPWSYAVVLGVAVVVYANSLGNGFAFDDDWAIVLNTVVTEGRFSDAFRQPAWPQAREGAGNYRPLMLSSFAIEWWLGSGSPGPFHVLNVLAHALVSTLVLALLSRYMALAGALAGAVFFAVHPVHSEAVANVMGRSELYAALGYLGACIVYLSIDDNRPLGRGFH